MEGLDGGLHFTPESLDGLPEVVGQLGPQPVARFQPEVGAEVQVGLGGDTAALFEDLVDALMG